MQNASAFCIMNWRLSRHELASSWIDAQGIMNWIPKGIHYGQFCLWQNFRLIILMEESWKLSTIMRTQFAHHKATALHHSSCVADVHHLMQQRCRMQKHSAQWIDGYAVVNWLRHELRAIPSWIESPRGFIMDNFAFGKISNWLYDGRKLKAFNHNANIVRTS